MLLSTELIIWFLFLNICFGSFLTVYDSNNISISQSQVNSYIFSLGSQDLPVTGIPLFVRGCSGISKVKDDHPLIKAFGSSNKFIAMVEFDDTDFSCTCPYYVAQCQSTSWCHAVFVQEAFFKPAGIAAWSIFDKHRPRSSYKVPYVEVSLEDFFLFQEKNSFSIVNGTIQNYSQIIVTADTNPWGEMFTSIPFLIIYQVIFPIWSVGCTIFSSRLLITSYKKMSKTQNANNHSSSNLLLSKKRKAKSVMKRIFEFCNISNVCLMFQVFSHVARVIFFVVDPFFSRQIFPVLASFLFMSCSTTFEICANVLLAFVVNEITKAKAKVNMWKEIRLAYCYILFFVFVDFTFSTLAGLTINAGSQSWIFKAVFYVLMNIVLGCWYFYKGYRFLRSSINREKRTNTKGRQRRVLTRIAMTSSLGMITFGLLTVLVTMRDFFGNPWGYFLVWGSLACTSQLTSFGQIFLFGGVTFDLKDVYTRLRKRSIYKSRHTSDETIDL